MKRAISIALVLLGGLTVWISGCSDGPLSVDRSGADAELAPAFAHLASGVTYEALSWTSPPDDDLTVRREVDDDGTVLRIAELGVTLRIPEHAVAVGRPDGEGRDHEPGGEEDEEDDDERDDELDDVTVELRAHAGGAVSLGFGPHGLRFRRPARLEIDLDRTSAAEDPSVLDDLVAVYYEGRPGPEIEGREVLPVRVEDGTLIVDLHHFSGYLLASG